MSEPKIIEEFEGKLWISSDHHIDAVTKAYESGKAVGAKAAREACAKLLDEMAEKDRLTNYYAVAARKIRDRWQA